MRSIGGGCMKKRGIFMKNKVQATADYTSTEQEHERRRKNIQLITNGKIVEKTHCNKIVGRSSEVYAFRTKEEISAMINVLNKHIEEAANDSQRQIAARNKMLFLIGINLGIRASDLHDLQWSFFYDVVNGKLVFKDFYVLQPKKQRNHHKFVKIFFNQSIKKAIDEYTENYPIDSVNSYLFPSRKGGIPVETGHLWRIVKETAIEAGINQNIGSHSLRKTFGYWRWHEAIDKTKALITLQQIFNHSDTLTTMKYIGITDNEIENLYMDVELGFDDI